MTGDRPFSDPYGTVYIDTEADAGAWAEAIANTRHLALQCEHDPLQTYEHPAPGQESNAND